MGPEIPAPMMRTFGDGGCIPAGSLSMSLASEKDFPA